MNQDERIEQVLQALVNAEAPEGLEQRVLRRMKAQPVKAPAIRRWLIPASALAACAAIALVFGPRMHVASPAKPGPAVAEIVKPLTPVQTEASIIRHMPVTRRARHAGTNAIVVSSSGLSAPLTEQERLLVKLAQASQREVGQAIEIPLANRDPKVAEVPLTHEEKLLVAVSRVRQDAVLDALDPGRRAEIDARERREFNAYVQQKNGGSL